MKGKQYRRSLTYQNFQGFVVPSLILVYCLVYAEGAETQNFSITQLSNDELCRFQGKYITNRIGFIFYSKLVLSKENSKRIRLKIYVLIYFFFFQIEPLCLKEIKLIQSRMATIIQFSLTSCLTLTQGSMNIFCYFTCKLRCNLMSCKSQPLVHTIFSRVK